MYFLHHIVSNVTHLCDTMYQELLVFPPWWDVLYYTYDEKQTFSKLDLKDFTGEVQHNIGDLWNLYHLKVHSLLKMSICGKILTNKYFILIFHFEIGPNAKIARFYIGHIGRTFVKNNWQGKKILKWHLIEKGINRKLTFGTLTSYVEKYCHLLNNDFRAICFIISYVFLYKVKCQHFTCECLSGHFQGR